MSPQLAVRAGPSPVLDEEEGETLGRAREVRLRVHGAQHRVGLHARVETLHECTKRLLSAGRLEDVRGLHADVEPTASHRAAIDWADVWPRVRWLRAAMLAM